jgi:hypothetical protein
MALVPPCSPALLIATSEPQRAKHRRNPDLGRQTSRRMIHTNLRADMGRRHKVLITSETRRAPGSEGQVCEKRGQEGAGQSRQAKTGWHRKRQGNAHSTTSTNIAAGR